MRGARAVSAASKLALPAPWLARWALLRTRWQAVGARERRLIGLALGVLGAFVVWSVAIQPAWRTLRDAPQTLDRLDAQLLQMRALGAEVRELRAAPGQNVEQSTQALQAASARLGGQARLSLQGDRAVLTLNGVSSSQLRQWLAEARAGARARPVEAQLSRTAQGFSGNIVLSLGAAQ
jgi:general secretion pathway protein M